MLTDRVAHTHKKINIYDRNVILYFWNASFSTLMAVLKNRAVQKYAYRRQNNDSVKSPYMLCSVGCFIDWELFIWLTTCYLSDLQICCQQNQSQNAACSLVSFSQLWERKSERESELIFHSLQVGVIYLVLVALGCQWTFALLVAQYIKDWSVW